MKACKQSSLNLLVLLIAFWLGGDLVYSQTNAQLRAVKPEIERLRKYKVPRPPHPVKIRRSSLPDYEHRRFEGKTEAQIDSIKRKDKEKEVFYTDFLNELRRAADYGHRRDSLEAVAGKYLDADTLNIPEQLQSDELTEYVSDALKGYPVEIAMYDSLYDDFATRNDSCLFIGKYHKHFMSQTRTCQALYDKVFGNEGMFQPTMNELRRRLGKRVDGYMAAYNVEPITVDPDSIISLVKLASSVDNDANHELILAMAEYIATGNVVYNELRDIRALRDTTSGNPPSLFMVKLIEMKLKLDNLYEKCSQSPNFLSDVTMKIDGMMSPGLDLGAGKYSPFALRYRLRFLLKNEHKKLTETVKSY